MKTLIAAGLSLAIAASAAPAFAKGAKSTDQDGDGRISMQEFQAKHERLFQRLDRDSDGQVTRAEFDRKAARKMSRKTSNGEQASGKGKRGGKDRFAKYDVDGDGALTRDEYLAHSEKQFQRRDRDGQGFITPSAEKRASR